MAHCLMDNETLTQTAQGAIESLRQSTARASGDLAAKSKVAVGAMSTWVGQQWRKSRQNVASARAASPELAAPGGSHAERSAGCRSLARARSPGHAAGRCPVAAAAASPQAQA